MSAFPTATMKAVVYSGKVSDQDACAFMTWKEDVPVPKGSGMIPVKVKYASINPVDYKLPVLSWMLRWGLKGSVMGLDCCGEVLDDSVPGFKKGDVVFGKAKSGSMGQYALLAPGACCKIPEGSKLKAEDATGLVVAGGTTVQAFERVKFAEGQSCGVVGASGGCGSLGVQIAKAMGASTVVGVCSGKNAGQVKALGADTIVDYSKGETFKSVLGDKTLDFVYDCVTSPDDPDYEGQASEVLGSTGQYLGINARNASRFVTEMTGLSPLLLPRNHHILLFEADKCAPYMKKLVDWVDAGKVQPVTATMMDFTEENVKKGFEMLKGRRTTGKICFKME